MKNMKNMKREPQANSTINQKEETYPYGLRINLDEETIKKLGFSGLPKVGQSLELVGKVKVVDVSTRDSESGKVRGLGLQITHLDFDDEKEDKKDPADVLYPKSKSNGLLNGETHAWGSKK